MELSEWIIYTVAEVLLVLVIACLLLLLHAKGLKVLISALQTKLAKAISDLRDAKKNQPSANGEQSYAEQIDAHLQATESYHADLSPDQPIETDITAATPTARLVAAMRHRFLRAEKEGLTQTPDSPDWERIEEHYRQLPAPKHSDPDVAIGNAKDEPEALLKLSYDEQRQEIERFKRLFTTMEGQWQTAKGKAENYYAQLMSLIGDSSDPNLLALKSLAEEQLAHINKVSTPVEPYLKAKAGHQDVDNLKAINERQKDEIASLQRRLTKASGDEERLAITADLERQLAQQLRFMKESEVCIDLLERELEDASRRIEKLEKQKPLAISSAENAGLLHDKQQLNRQIQQLKGENEQLVSLTEHADVEQKRIIALKNKEVETIKAKFTELARRYKALANGNKKG